MGGYDVNTGSPWGCHGYHGSSNTSSCLVRNNQPCQVLASQVILAYIISAKPALLFQFMKVMWFWSESVKQNTVHTFAAPVSLKYFKNIVQLWTDDIKMPQKVSKVTALKGVLACSAKDLYFKEMMDFSLFCFIYSLFLIYNSVFSFLSFILNPSSHLPLLTSAPFLPSSYLPSSSVPLSSSSVSSALRVRDKPTEQ